MVILQKDPHLKKTVLHHCPEDLQHLSLAGEALHPLLVQDIKDKDLVVVSHHKGSVDETEGMVEMHIVLDLLVKESIKRAEL